MYPIMHPFIYEGETKLTKFSPFVGTLRREKQSYARENINVDNASHRAIITMMNSKRNIASGTDQKAKTVPALFIHCVLLSFSIVSLKNRRIMENGMEIVSVASVQRSKEAFIGWRGL